MKFTGFFLINLLIFSSAYSLSEETPRNKTKTDEQSFTVSPNPANIYLEVKIIPGLTCGKDTTKRPYDILVQVFNQKGMMVFSATKKVNEFSIFTGGLPAGDYNISCKVDTMVFQRGFVVKH